MTLVQVGDSPQPRAPLSLWFARVISAGPILADSSHFQSNELRTLVAGPGSRRVPVSRWQRKQRVSSVSCDARTISASRKRSARPLRRQWICEGRKWRAQQCWIDGLRARCLHPRCLHQCGGRPIPGLDLRDVICRTRTPAAPGAAATLLVHVSRHPAFRPQKAFLAQRHVGWPPPDPATLTAVLRRESDPSVSD